MAGIIKDKHANASGARFDYIKWVKLKQTFYHLQLHSYSLEDKWVEDTNGKILLCSEGKWTSRNQNTIRWEIVTISLLFLVTI